MAAATVESQGQPPEKMQGSSPCRPYWLINLLKSDVSRNFIEITNIRHRSEMLKGDVQKLQKSALASGDSMKQGVWLGFGV